MIDLLIVVAFVVYSIGSGLRARGKASLDSEEYFLAGRTLRGWKSGLSMAATQFAADTPLLVAGLVATAGVFALWRLWIYALAFLLMAFVLSGAWRRSGVLTDAELTEIRYSGRGTLSLRALKAIYYGTVINCVVLAMVMVAAVRIAEAFLPWHDWLPSGIYQPVVALVRGLGLRLGDPIARLDPAGQPIPGLDPATATASSLISILLIVAFTATYSMTGGLRAVVNTDVVQLAIGLIGTAIYAWVVVSAAGGPFDMAEKVVELYGEEQATRLLSFAPSDLVMPFLVVISLQWLFQMNSDGTGYLAQRSMACHSQRDARLAGVIFTWTQVLLRSLLWVAISVGLLILYPSTPEQAAADGFAAWRETLFVDGISQLLPPGARGLMLTGLLAALASTVDTHLNWGASYWSNDIYGRLVCRQWLRREPKQRELVLVARLSNVIILVFALIIMANLGSIQAAWSISLLFGAGMGLVLVLRWVWERISLYSEFAAMATSLITAPLLLVTLGTDPDTEWVRLGTMALVTTAAAVGVTYVTPMTDDRVLVDFYKKVRPFGFWSRSARLAGDDPQAPIRGLGRQLVSVGVSAASLFLLLVGLGRLMIELPGTSAWWTWIMIVAGIALVPVWWRDTVRDDAELAALGPQLPEGAERAGVLAAAQTGDSRRGKGPSQRGPEGPSGPV